MWYHNKPSTVCLTSNITCDIIDVLYAHRNLQLTLAFNNMGANGTVIRIYVCILVQFTQWRQLFQMFNTTTINVYWEIAHFRHWHSFNLSDICHENKNSGNLVKTRVQTYRHSSLGNPSCSSYSIGSDLVNLYLKSRDRDFHWINHGRQSRLSLSLISLICHGLWTSLKRPDIL